ncbi:MAG: type II toxin-antitoxin system VapC family toxin [Acidobacteriaceae bacterium]
MPRRTDRRHGVLLDTHIWIRLQSGALTLSRAALNAIDAATAVRSVFVPLISVWEIAMLTTKKRLQFDRPVRRWVEEALDKPGLELLPFTTDIAIEAALLPEPMHKDPADRIIVASARVERLTLITCDKLMLSFGRSIGLDCIQG